jgi:spore coat-associated protein N
MTAIDAGARPMEGRRRARPTAPAGVRRRVLGLGRAPLLAGLSVLALVSAGSGALTVALFTDAENIPATFSAGTVVLDDARIGSLVLTATSLRPGNTITDDVVVENDGSAQIRYALTTSSTNTDAKNLRGVVTLTVKTIDVTTPAAPCDQFDGTTTIVPATVLFNGTTSVGFGNPASGAQAGDRTLAVGGNETLCFRVTLPSSVSDAYQAATTTTTFTFTAEQTANNP